MNQRQQYWLHVFLFTLLIYSTLSIVRPISSFLRSNTPFLLLTNTLLILLFFVLGLLIRKHVLIKRASTCLGLFAAAVAYLYLFMTTAIPEEKVHFIEYGILAFLIHRAVSLNVRGVWPYFFSLALVTVLGWGDEGIQHILPNRYYEIRDVVLNIKGGGLGLFVIWVCKRDTGEA